MPTFAASGPVSARIDVSAGSVRVRAGDRSDVVVEVRPSGPSSAAGLQAAEQTRVEFEDGTLLVTTPRRPRLLFFATGSTVDIDVSLPEGSRVDVVTAAGDVHCSGRLGPVLINARYGDVRVDGVTTLRAVTATGDIVVEEVEGSAEAATSYGSIRVGCATGDVRLDTAAGDITVDESHASVAAATKYGQVRVRRAVRGSLDLATAYGEVEAGVREGTAAWLDLSAASGTVRSSLSAADAPGDSEDTVRIRARTSYGDIRIRRA